MMTISKKQKCSGLNALNALHGHIKPVLSVHLWCHLLIWKIVGASIVKEPALDLQLIPSNDPEI